MVSVMIIRTMLTAIMMVETVVDPALSRNTALNVFVLVKILEMEFQTLYLEMAFATMKQITMLAVMMVEIAVLMSTRITVLIVYVII
jgi:hypothetical protein